MKTDDSKLITPDDVERDFKIARATQASMRSRRQIPFVLLGPRMPRYVRAELLAWIHERRVPAANARRGRK